MARLYVGKLPNSARERDLEKFFKGYGKIREVVLKAGYGFVVSKVSTIILGLMAMLHFANNFVNMPVRKRI